MNKQERILYSLLLLFFITLFPSWLRTVNIIVMSAIVVYCYAAFPIQEKLKMLKQRKFIQAMIFFSLLVLMSFGLSDNTGKGVDYLILRLPLLLFPISLGLIYLRTDFKLRVLLTYAIVATFYCILSLGTSTYNYFSLQRNDAIYNDNLTLVISQQSIYVALLVNIAIFVFLYYILFLKAGYKFWMLLAVVFLFVISYLLGSRINMAGLMAMSIGVILYYIISRKLVLEGLAVGLALIIGSFLILKFQPQMLNRYKELSYNEFSYEHRGQESHYNMELTEDQWNGANMRLAIWNCGWEVFKENPIVGVGLGDKDDELIDKYQQKNFHFAIETKKNVHNNYLDILLSMGIVGFLAFVVAWVALPVASALQGKDGLALIIILTFALAWITEIYFNRSLGGIISGFFISFLLIDKKAEGQP